MNLLRWIWILAALAPIPVMAQQVPPPLALSSSLTTGWTSNAEASAAGRGDSFVEHRHQIVLTTADEHLSLRGTLGLEQTRYQRLWQEDDLQLNAALEMGYRLAPGIGVSAHFDVAHHIEGQAIPLGPDLIAVATPYLDLRTGFGLEFARAGTVLALELGYGGWRHGLSRFDQPALIETRTRADFGAFDGGLALSHALDPHVALTGTLRGRLGVISLEDQIAFARIPAHAVRLAAGLEAAFPLRAAFALELGADVIMPGAPGPRTALVPFARGAVDLVIAPGLALRTGFATRLDFETPADGYADALIEARAGLAATLAPRLEIGAGVFAKSARAVGLDTQFRREWGGELSLQIPLAEGLDAGATLTHRRVSGLAPGFEETRLALVLNAML